MSDNDQSNKKTVTGYDERKCNNVYEGYISE